MTLSNSRAYIGANSKLLLLVASCAICVVWLVMWRCQYGFDFTDEGFYLAWVANPFIYDWSSTQFGSIYHPLYQLLGGDVVLLRQANVAITFFSSYLLARSLCGLLVGHKGTSISGIVVSAGLASTSLVFFAVWLPSPNYNSLALQGLLIAASGLVLTQRSSERSLLAPVLLGIGGWLTFMAKPTTAAALGFCVVLCWFVSGNFRFRPACFALLTAAASILLSAFILDGSVSQFAQRLEVGYTFAKLLGGGHTIERIFRVDAFSLSGTQYVAAIVLALTAATAAVGVCAKQSWAQRGAFLLCASFVVVTFSLAADLHARVLTPAPYIGLLLLSVLAAATLSALVFYARCPTWKVPLAQWAIALFLFVSPHIFAFGTGRNYWEAGTLAGVFWVLSGCVLLGPVIRERSNFDAILPLVLLAQLLTLWLLQTGFDHPYRQPHPLRENSELVSLDGPVEGLVLPREYARYINEAVSLSVGAGMKRRQPVIDLTGQSPGLLFAMGASNTGQAWMIGGYEGSYALARSSLNRRPCTENAAAWILVEPQGPRNISSDLLQSFGANLERDYVAVAQWETAEGAGGYLERRTQILYKPIRGMASAVKTCETARERNGN